MAVSQTNKALDNSTTRLLRVISKVSCNSSTRLGRMENRIAVLRSSRLDVDTGAPILDTANTESNDQGFMAGFCDQGTTTRSAPLLTPTNVAAPNVVDRNTVFGTASVGGATVELTVNSLVVMVQELEAQ